MRRELKAGLLVGAALFGNWTVILPAVAAVSEIATTPRPAASVAELVRAVDLPYERFTLANGLRVIVHEDRKAPLVHISLWYNAGSKDEKKGKTGLAHLFEHLAPPDGGFDWFKHLQSFGSIDSNASTWYDRTNYFETVPTGALEAALFLKSNRAGQFFGGFGQATLSTQIAVVQNELRQDDNDPYDGPVKRAYLQGLFPDWHPYGHPNGGTIADVGSATLADVHKWQQEKFGPNNAVLVLAGDIDAATARPLVEKYFGEIPRGSTHKPVVSKVPTLKARIDEVIKDKVGKTRLYRFWTGPGLLHPDAIALETSAGLLGGITSSRLNNALVQGDHTAVMTYASQTTFQGLSIFQIGVDVKPGADVEAVSRRLDSIIADYIANGPTAEEVRRATTTKVAGRIRELEKIGNMSGKASALAEGELFANDPENYKKKLLAYSSMTPARVGAAARKWLGRPAYALRLEPGEREAMKEAPPVANSALASPNRAVNVSVPAPKSRIDRTKLPALAPIGDVDFPDVQRGKLSNGIEVVLAHRPAMPVVQVAVEIDAGFAADPKGRAGLQKFVASMLDEGTLSRSALQLAEEKERLGATLDVSASIDRTNARLSALKPNLSSSLDLLADVLRNPAFPAPDIERTRSQQLAAIASEKADPDEIIDRVYAPLLYGANHPYGVPSSGSGTTDAVKLITREELLATHRDWIRPDNATIFVSGDVALAEILPLLEERFGTWRPPNSEKGRKSFALIPTQINPRIVLIDKPKAPQSAILAMTLLPARGIDDLTILSRSFDPLGAGYLSRVNLDLREDKGWAYYAFGATGTAEHQVPYYIQTSVQSDRTGASIAAIREQITAFLTTKGTTPAEVERIKIGTVRALPSRYETSTQILSELQSNARYKRPDNYQETLASRYRAVTAQELDRLAREAVKPNNFIYIVVGDAATVRPQLQSLGMTLEEMPVL